MLKAVLISIGSLVTIFVTVFIYSACVVSSRCNKTMDDYQTDILLKKDEGRGLTSLEMKHWKN